MAEAKAFTKEQLAEMTELHFGHCTCLESTWLATIRERDARIAELEAERDRYRQLLDMLDPREWMENGAQK